MFGVIGANHIKKVNVFVTLDKKKTRQCDSGFPLYRVASFFQVISFYITFLLDRTTKVKPS